MLKDKRIREVDFELTLAATLSFEDSQANFMLPADRVNQCAYA